jgi:hypothetical protein
MRDLVNQRDPMHDADTSGDRSKLRSSNIEGCGLNHPQCVAIECTLGFVRWAASTKSRAAVRRRHGASHPDQHGGTGLDAYHAHVTGAPRFVPVRLPDPPM